MHQEGGLTESATSLESQGSKKQRPLQEHCCTVDAAQEAAMARAGAARASLFDPLCGSLSPWTQQALLCFPGRILQLGFWAFKAQGQ